MCFQSSQENQTNGSTDRNEQILAELQEPTSAHGIYLRNQEDNFGSMCLISDNWLIHPHRCIQTGKFGTHLYLEMWASIR